MSENIYRPEATEKTNFNIPLEFKKFYNVDQTGQLVNKDYLNTQEVSDNTKIPPMIVVASPEELKLGKEIRYARPNHEGIYDEFGLPQTTYDYYTGLENYYIVFINQRPT